REGGARSGEWTRGPQSSIDSHFLLFYDNRYSRNKVWPLRRPGKTNRMEDQMGRMGWIAAGLLASAGTTGLPAPAAAATAQATAPASPDIDALLEPVSSAEMAPGAPAL